MGVFTKLAERYADYKEHKQLLKFVKELIGHLEHDELSANMVMKLNGMNERLQILEDHKIKNQLLIHNAVVDYNANVYDHFLKIDYGCLKPHIWLTHEVTITLYTAEDTGYFTLFSACGSTKEEACENIHKSMIKEGVYPLVKPILAQIKANREAEERRIAEEARLKELANQQRDKVETIDFRDPSTPYHFAYNTTSYWKMYEEDNTCPVSGRLYPFYLSSDNYHEMRAMALRKHKDEYNWIIERSLFLQYKELTVGDKVYIGSYAGLEVYNPNRYEVQRNNKGKRSLVDKANWGQRERDVANDFWS